MSNRPKRNSSVPVKFSSLSGTINKLNGDGGRRTPRLAAAALEPDAATGDSRCSTPVSCNSSSAATTRSRSSQKPATKPTADRTKQRANKSKGRKSRSLMQDVVDDDECDDGLEGLDDESCSESETSDGHEEMDDLDDETAGNDDMEGSLADDNVSIVWSEATADSVSVASNVGKLPRRPKSPEFIPDIEVPTLDLPSSSTDLCVNGADVMLAVTVYEVLRRFRAMVRLSPFRFEDFCAALSATGTDDYSMLLVEIHTALIRALLREDDGNNTTFGPYDTKDSIAIAMHFVDAMTWYECTRSYLDSDPQSVEFCAALPMVGRTSYSVLTVNERLRLLRTLADLFLATNAVRKELTNEGNIHYDDHCRSCHRLGDLLCCDTCPAVYHLSCLENPLAEVPEEEWQCSICKLHQLKGVTDCLSDVEKSGLLCRQEPIGYDRHRRKYWFICRRIIVESENDGETCYYSTVPQLEQLLETLDADNYEHDLVQAIAEMREEIERQMKITEELTHKVQAGRRSMIDVLNEAILKKRSQKTAETDDKSDAAAENSNNAMSNVDDAAAEDDSSSNALDTAEPNDTGDTAANGQSSDDARIAPVNGKTATCRDQTPSADSSSAVSAAPPATGTTSTPAGSKMLCVINKDGSKTFMTLVSGKNLSTVTPSSSSTSLASVSSDTTLSAEARRNIVTRSKTGSLAPKQFTDSILTPTGNLKTAIRASMADHVETDGNEVVTRSRSAFTVTPVTGYFKLGLEGKYKHYQNLYRTNSLALNKNQHTEERDKKRILSHKFSLTAASEFSWNGATFGALAVLVGTLRATILQLESNIPTPFLHPNWSLHRARWLKQVNACSQPEDFGAVLSTFEAVIKPVVFNQIWHEALGHVRLRRCPMLDRDETRKKEREQRKRKVDEDEELQCKNTWVKYTLGIRHSVYKQKGEEYRITGQGGWFWVSATRSFRVVPAESVGLRLIAAKLRARRQKRQAATAAGTPSDTSADPTPTPGDNFVYGIGCAKDAETDKLDCMTEPKPDSCSDCENNEVKVEKMETDGDNVKNETTSDEKPPATNDVKNDVTTEVNVIPKCMEDSLTETSVSDVKPDEDDNIEVSEIPDAVWNDDDFSVSEALINRTHYPRFTKPYSRLEHLLDRRLAQLQVEQKQRLICEQLIARFRAQDTQKKSVAVESDTSAKVSSMELEEASSSKLDEDDAETSSTTVRYVCYSAVCRAQGECDKQTCYSIECRQRRRRRKTTPTPSLALEASDDDLTDSGVEDNEDMESSSAVATCTDAAAGRVEKKSQSVSVAKSAETTDSEASLCNDVTPADSDEAKNVASKPIADVTFANCLSTLPSSLPTSAPENSAAATAVPPTAAAVVPNNAIPRSRIGRFKTMKQIEAAAAAAANSGAAADKAPVERPVSPSLSLQKYMQDGKILLTAELVSVLESKLAIYGQTRYKASLPKRAGPGRPSAKGSGNLASRGPPLQKKLALPPVHRFWAGRVGKRSLFAVERQVLRSVARREGRRECPGFNYNCKMVNVGWPYPCPRPLFRTAWRYRTQTLTSIAGAALQLRIMWACIRWDDIVARIPSGGQNTVSTDTDITTTELLKKRDIPPLGLRSEYLVRKLVVPINVPTTQPREKYTPQRSGLRERRRAESPKNREPSVTEVWLPEEQLDLWQIKYFAEKIEKQKASAHEKLAVQQKQPAALEAAASTTTVVSTLKPSGTLASQLESDLKLQRVAMAQKRLLNTSTAAAVTSSGQNSVATPGTPVSGARLAGLQPRSLLAGQSATSSASPSMQNLRITQGLNGQLHVQGLLPGQQIMRLPDGRLHLISSTSTQANQSSTVTIPAQSTTVTLPAQTSISLPQTPRQTLTTPRTVLVGGQRVINLSSLSTTSPTAAPQLVIAGSASGAAAGTQFVTLNVAGGTSSQPTPGRPRLAPAVQQQTTTLIRMPSGQQLLVRPSQIVTLGQQRPGTSLLTGTTMLGVSPGGSTLLPATSLNSPKSPATGSSGYAVTPQVVQQVVSRALLQTQDPGIQAKLLAMQKQMQQVTGTILLPPDEDLNTSDRFTPASFAGKTSASHGHDQLMSRFGKTLTHEQKEEQTRLAACMQVMKSLLDSIERQERTEQKRQRKQETFDERLKRVSQQKLEALLVRQKENLKKDILKKRSLLEREITSDIQSEVSAALAARYNRNVPMLAVAAAAPATVTSPARKRRSDGATAATPAPPFSAAYEAAATKPPQALHTPSNAAAVELKSRRGRQKTTTSTTGGSTVPASTAVSADTQLYCLCQTPYDDSKFYIGCDKCEDWFHGSCVGVTKSEADQMDSYVCPRCRESDSKDSAARTPLQERQFAELRKLVHSLRAHRMSWPFLEPVNASEVPDYYIVIKEPVDLQTIQSRIDYRQYTCFNDFVKDITKMFDNCRYYNAPNTPFYRCADSLEAFFVEKLKSFKGKM